VQRQHNDEASRVLPFCIVVELYYRDTAHSICQSLILKNSSQEQGDIETVTVELPVEYVLCDAAKATNIALIKNIKPCEEGEDCKEKLTWECDEWTDRCHNRIEFHQRYCLVQQCIVDLTCIHA
jgi:hypothetical protein